MDSSSIAAVEAKIKARMASAIANTIGLYKAEQELGVAVMTCFDS